MEEKRSTSDRIKSAKVVLSLSVGTLLRHRSHSPFFHTSSRSSVCRVSRMRLISNRPRERFQRAFRKLIGKVLMNHLTLCSKRGSVSHPRRWLSIRADVTSCLACHTISRRKATIKALRLYLPICYLRMFSAFTVNAVTFRKEHLLWHRMRVTEEECTSVMIMEGAGAEGKEKQ